MDTIAKRLKYAMDMAGLKQSGLAQKIGAPRSAVSQYLSGHMEPGTARMQALADATGVTVGFLDGSEPLVVTKQTAPVVVKNISTAAAARCMGKSEKFVRVGLQRGLLPFGNAVPVTANRYSYYISPFQFRDYVGYELFDTFFGRNA